jgi:hypothetical protein
MTEVKATAGGGSALETGVLEGRRREDVVGEARIAAGPKTGHYPIVFASLTGANSDLGLRFEGHPFASPDARNLIEYLASGYSCGRNCVLALLGRSAVLDIV